MDVDDIKHWYVLRAIFHGELIVRDMLRYKGIISYVPMHYCMQTVNQKTVRRLVPAISELVFVYGSQAEITAFKQSCKRTVYWLMRPASNGHERIIIPDKDMDDFIRITQQHEREVTYFRPDELSLRKGDCIRIHGGVFDGVEGVLMKVKGKREKQLLVSIPDLAVAAVSIKPDVVEVVAQQPEPSHDVLGDSKELIRLSTAMLASPPDQQSARHEWDLLHREIQRLYQSLLSRKGYIVATEAQLSLSLLLAERVLDSVTDTTIQRCRTAATRLRPSKLRDQLLEELKKNT